ncbi:MAG: hypothetical protein ACE5HJ_05350 [Thermoplasmata archaeon]
MEEGERPRTFRRRRPPSPEATRLMLFSLVAAIGLAAVLTYVFLPTLLHYEQLSKEPQYDLAAIPDGSSLRIEIVGASSPRELEEFEVLLIVDSEDFAFGPLPDGIEGVVSFFDNGDGILNVGDYFLLEVQQGKTYRLLILPVDRVKEEGVGYFKWPP